MSCHRIFIFFCRLNPQRASKIDNRFSILIGYFLNKGLQLNQKDVFELKVSPLQPKSGAIVHLKIHCKPAKKEPVNEEDQPVKCDGLKAWFH